MTSRSVLLLCLACLALLSEGIRQTKAVAGALEEAKVVAGASAEAGQGSSPPVTGKMEEAGWQVLRMLIFNIRTVHKLKLLGVDAAVKHPVNDVEYFPVRLQVDPPLRVSNLQADETCSEAIVNMRYSDFEELWGKLPERVQLEVQLGVLNQADFPEKAGIFTGNATKKRMAVARRTYFQRLLVVVFDKLKCSDCQAGQVAVDPQGHVSKGMRMLFGSGGAFYSAKTNQALHHDGVGNLYGCSARGRHVNPHQPEPQQHDVPSAPIDIAVEKGDWHRKRFHADQATSGDSVDLARKKIHRDWHLTPSV